jgi:hypothetical protein
MQSDLMKHRSKSYCKTLTSSAQLPVLDLQAQVSHHAQREAVDRQGTSSLLNLMHVLVTALHALMIRQGHNNTCCQQTLALLLHDMQEQMTCKSR